MNSLRSPCHCSLSLTTLAADKPASLPKNSRKAGAKSPLEEKALTWLRHSRPSVVQGCRVYTRQLGPARVRAVTRLQDKSERLQLVQVVWPQAGGPPQLLEAVPGPTGDSKGGALHLLPLPAGASSLARRWDEAGQLSAEVIVPTGAVESCLDAWREAGWSSQDLSAAGAPFVLHLLSRGEQKVYLCHLAAGKEKPGALLAIAHRPASPSEKN